MRILKIIAISILTVAVAFFTWPLFLGEGCKASLSTADLSNMKQMSLSLMLYTVDNDDRLPTAQDWTDQAERYARVEGAMRCYLLPKDAPKDSCGHVMERSMPGRNLAKIADAAEEVMLFDGVKLERNATDSLLGIDFSRDEKPLAIIAYADGHSKRFRPRVRQP